MMNNWKKKRAKKAMGIVKASHQDQQSDHKLLKKIRIKWIDNPVQKALDYYQQSNPEAQDSQRFPREQLIRITLNYIRHNCSNYEQVVKQIGASRYNNMGFKERVNQVIMNKYYLNDVKNKAIKL